MYPDDPRPSRSRDRRTGREQILMVLMAIGIAIVVTVFGAGFLWFARLMQGQ